jgi:hypothetical protein
MILNVLYESIPRIDIIFLKRKYILGKGLIGNRELALDSLESN